MQYAQQRSPGSNAIGIGLVVALHLGVGYALLHALAKQDVNRVPPPLEARVFEEKPKIVEPPPPPPSTPIEHQKLDFRPPIDLTITPPPVPVRGPAVTTTPPDTHDMPRTAAVEPPAPLADTRAGAKRIAGPPLQYPRRPLAAQEEGSVDVQCDVDEVGGTSNCISTGHQGSIAFVDAAMDYVKATRYSPATHNGVPVSERDHRFHIDFKLSDK
jgi:periplasmic protein TonB